MLYNYYTKADVSKRKADKINFIVLCATCIATKAYRGAVTGHDTKGFVNGFEICWRNLFWSSSSILWVKLQYSSAAGLDC